METVSFVILHYRDVSVTDACVQSVQKLDGQEQIRIVVVDNDVFLPAEEREKLQRRYASDSRIRVIPITEDRGFSYANNQGYRYAREAQKAAFVIICNNDIAFVQKDFLKRMEESFRGQPCHVLGPDIIRQESGEHQNPMDTRLRTKEEAQYTIRMNRLALRFFPAVYPFVYLKLKREQKAKQNRQRERQAFYGSRQRNVVPFGACLIFTPLFVKREEEAFTPETPFFYEEYLLAYRCRRKKYEILYDPSMTVRHADGAATKKTYRTEKARIRFMLERTEKACEIYLRALGTDV